MKNALLSLTLIVAQQILAVAPIYVCKQADGATTIHFGLHGCVAAQAASEAPQCCCRQRQQSQATPSRARNHSPVIISSTCCDGEHGRLPELRIARLESSPSRTNHATLELVLFAQAHTDSNLLLCGTCMLRSWPAPHAQCELAGADVNSLVLRC